MYRDFIRYTFVRLCIFTLPTLHLNAQEYTVHAYAENRYSGFFYNCGEYTLSVAAAMDIKFEYNIHPKEKRNFAAAQILKSPRWYYRYDERQYRIKENQLLRLSRENYKKFWEEVKKTSLQLNIITVSVDWDHLETGNSLEILKKYVDEVQKYLQNISLKIVRKEFDALKSSVEAIIRNRNFFKTHSNYSENYSIEAGLEFKNSRHYKDYKNPNLILDEGWIVAKRALNDDFVGKGTMNSLMVNGFLGLTTDNKLSTNTFGKLYLHVLYERLCFGLSEGSVYYLNSQYLKDDRDQYSRLPTNKGIDLCINQLGTGLDYSIFQKKIRLDLGLGIILVQSGYLNFSRSVVYGDLKANKLNQTVSKTNSFPASPYATAGISFWTKNWIAKGSFFRLSGSVQQLSLKSDNGIFIYEKNKQFGSYNSLDMSLPKNNSLINLKLSFGIAF